MMMDNTTHILCELLKQSPAHAAWVSIQAVVWYVHNRPFDEFFLAVFPDHEPAPDPNIDTYKLDWQESWRIRSLGGIFSRLDFTRQTKLIEAALTLYALDAANSYKRAVERTGR